ncbi:MAG: stalk domain-containing protein [Tissierellia bacterium]|nr:stalk domain-containing protein [Tissierellia bacterium]
MKRYLILLMCIFIIIPNYSVEAKGAQAKKSDQAILVDGDPISMGAYNVEGNNYVRLRDLAAVLKGTGAQFNVAYNPEKRQVSLNSQENYRMMATDLSPLPQDWAQADLAKRVFLVDGLARPLKTALIQGNNYIQLRDLSQYISFQVDYDQATRSVWIHTGLEESDQTMADEVFYTTSYQLSGPGVFYEEDQEPAVNPLFNQARYQALLAQGLSQEEAELAEWINYYRRQLGQPEFYISKSLTQVARTHVADSIQNQPEYQVDRRGIQGNLHSWSDQGSWQPVTYTEDHQYADLMWSKPRELTSYRGHGFEISAKGFTSPLEFLEGWKGSPGHNAVIVGSGDWSDLRVMGVGIEGAYAHVWFGEDPDPMGYYGQF